MKAPQFGWVDQILKSLGSSATVVSEYTLAEAALTGSSVLGLETVLNLYDNKTLLFNTETYSIRAVDTANNQIELSTPLLTPKEKGDRFIIVETGYVKVIPGAKNFAGDVLEHTRFVRMKKGWSINHSGLLSTAGLRYFLIGIEPGQISQTVKVKEINSRVNIEKPVKSEGPFGKVSTLQLIHTDVPAYVQAITSRLLEERIGLVPDTITVILVQDNIELDINYRVQINDSRFKVTGVDNSTYKNMKVATVTYDTNR